MTNSITALDEAGLRDVVAELGGKPFQARQLEHWVYKHGALTYDGCRNLPRTLLDKLAAWGPICGSAIEHTERSADGTEKHLLRLGDGETVECVSIPDGERQTLCISTQVGCPVACVFCASGMEGVRRNLTTAEIVEQVLHARSALPAGTQLTNIVVMGMGEPMLNLAQLLPALERIHDSDGIAMGARRITVSTSGYPDRIDQLARLPGQYQLAVSLHAADDALRAELVPTAVAKVHQIVEAAARYGSTKGREVTFEIVALAGVNDRPRDADDLVRVLRGVRCTVNLIAWNPVQAMPHLRRPNRAHVDAFAERLREGGLRVTVRRQRGADRSAACGQLRLRQGSQTAAE